jgi:anti-sigma B factor antagonist
VDGSCGMAALLPREGEIFAIEVRADGAARELALEGELDLTGAPRLWAALADAMAEGHAWIALELGQLEFIDCAGIGVIERARRQLRALGGDLTVRHPKGHVRRVIELCASLPGPVQGRDPPPASIDVLPEAGAVAWLGVAV